MRTLIFQHTQEEKPGTLVDWHRARGIAHDVHHWYRGSAAPRAGEYDWLVVLGGPMNLDEEEKYPWLRDEKKFLRDWLTTGKPVLGICLGGQLLAQALGGSVKRNREREIGFIPVLKTGAQHPAFRRWPEKLPVYQYHEDAFTLPTGAVSLATSPACAHQAYAIGTKRLGLQFHPESTVEWIRGNAASITKQDGETYVQTPAETEALTAKLLPPLTASFFHMLDDYVEGWGR